MTEDLNNDVRKLRFLDEDGQTYPDWEEKQVSDVFNISRGKVIAKSSVSQEKNEIFKYPIYSSQTLNDGIMGYGKNYNFEGDSLTWTTDGAYAGKVRYRTGEYSCTNVCGVLQAKNDFSGMANKLMENIIGLKTPLHVVKVGNPKLMSNIMADIEISIPSLPEQEKIANLLSKMDERIELEAKLIELRKKEKQGYMQRILGGGGEYRSLRFKKDDGTDYEGWEEKKLGEVADWHNGFAFKPKDLSSEGTTVVKIKEMIDQKDLSVKTKLTNIPKNNIIENGDILFSWSMTIAIKKWCGGRAFLNQHLYKVVPKSKKFNNMFVYYLVESELPKLSNLAHGGTAKHITRPSLMNYMVSAPSLPEQEKIAAFLSNLDKRIDEELNKLEQLKQEKQGYMQRVLG